MNAYQQFCGIDVSKDTLDYCLLPLGETKFPEQVHQLSNDRSSIRTAFATETFTDTLFVIESTGSYSTKALAELSNLQYPIFLVSPYKSKSFMDAQGVSSKNDRQAAYSLARMGQSMDVRLYRAPSIAMQERKQILATFKALQKQQRMLSNQIHALEHQAYTATAAIEALRTTLLTVEEQLATLKAQLFSPSDEKLLERKKPFATSVVGIGVQTAEALLLLTNNLDNFDHAGQVAKFLGIVNRSHDSGQSVRRKGGITKFGSSQARSLLYMCARSAVQHNHACKALYQRLRAKDKPHKVAMVAVMNKLITQFFHCVKHEVLFDNEHYFKNKK